MIFRIVDWARTRDAEPTQRLRHTPTVHYIEAEYHEGLRNNNKDSQGSDNTGRYKNYNNHSRFQISGCPIARAVLRASQFWNQLACGTSSFWLAHYQHRSVNTVFLVCSEVPECKTNFYLCSPHVPISSHIYPRATGLKFLFETLSLSLILTLNSGLELPGTLGNIVHPRWSASDSRSTFSKNCCAHIGEVST